MELKDTTKIMISPNYKERFTAEYLQLKIRYDKLNQYINKIRASEEYKHIVQVKHDCPIELLNEQLYAMKRYMDLLEIRAIFEEIDLEICDIYSYIDRKESTNKNGTN